MRINLLALSTFRLAQILFLAFCEYRPNGCLVGRYSRRLPGRIGMGEALIDLFRPRQDDGAY